VAALWIGRANRNAWAARIPASSAISPIQALRTAASVLSSAVVVLVVLFWVSLTSLAWTHAVYPAFARALARVLRRPLRKDDIEPAVTIVIAAYNEESSIARRIENLLELDYPADRLRIVVSSDASTDRTEEIALEYPGVHVISNPRGGKVAAQDRAVRQADSEIVAFSDANCTWSPDALRKLVRSFADPDVAYVCGQLRILRADGSNKEGVYWRYELGVRDAESRLGSVTGGNGSIYALRRSDYVEVDPRFGHDLSLPYLMVQRGRRAVYEPDAHAWEKPTPTNETEYRRKVRMFEHCWLIVLRGKMLRRLGLVYGLEIVSHRLLRYGSGILHVILLVASLALVSHGWVYDAVLAAQLGLLAAAAAGVGIARYYVLVTWATLVSLVNYLRRGVPAHWTPEASVR
jgi:cellulose synthase/poly-beta-1,6-N-acetylglucosamine synthase-like glycosyltransferase